MNPDLRFSAEEIVAVRNAFNREYKDRGLIKAFLKHAAQCLQSWDRAKYYSAYFALVQASTSGKSSLLYRTGNCVYVVYCCLRDPESGGYPERSIIAKNLEDVEGQSSGQSLAKYAAYLYACIEYLTKFDVSPEEFLNQQDRQFWLGIKNRMEELQKEWSHIASKDLAGRETEFVSKLKDLWKLFLQNSRKISSDQGFSPYVIFAFDEARTLTKRNQGRETAFTFLRQACRCLPTAADNGRVIAVFTDTTSQISNFSSVKDKDISFRVTQQGLELFPQFHLLDTVDVNVDVAPKTICESQDPEFFLRYGLPLWYSLKSAKDDNGRPILETSKILNIVKSKLVGGLDFKKWCEPGRKVQLEEALAVLGCRACIDIAPQSQIASDMVASYMRLCYYISEDRYTMITNYPSDPTMTEAASQIMNCVDVLQWEHFLQPLITAMKEGVVEAGYRGELAARLLLLRAWDKASLKTQQMSPEVNVFSRSMTLEQFLSSLLASDNFDKVKLEISKSKNSPLNLRLRFNHFIQCTYTPTRMQLVEFFCRCAAVLCKRNQTGVDIILPLFSGTEDDDLAPARFSYVLIQIKNHKGKRVDSNFPNSAASMLTPVYAELEYEKPYLPFLSLYMSLGAPSPDFQIVHSGMELRGDEKKLAYGNAGSSKKKRKGKDKDYGKSKNEYVELNEDRTLRMRYQTSLATFGISDNVFGCINAKEGQLLVNLADAWPDPVKLYADEEDVLKVKRMAPLVYSLSEKKTE